MWETYFKFATVFVIFYAVWRLLTWWYQLHLWNGGMCAKNGRRWILWDTLDDGARVYYSHGALLKVTCPFIGRGI